MLSAATTVRAEESAVPTRPLTAAIHVEPGATCLSQAGVTAQVESWLGRSELDAAMSIELAGDPTHSQTASFRLVRVDAETVRRFDRLPMPCADATTIVGLAIALAIDAGVLSRLLGSPPAAPRRTRLAVALAFGRLLLSPPAFGATAGVDHDINSWLRTRLDLLVLHARGQAVNGTSGLVDDTTWAVQATLCAGGRIGHEAGFALCSGAALGLLYARGRGFVSSYAERGRLLIGTAGVRLTWKLGLPWVVDVAALLPIKAPAIRARSASGSELRASTERLGVLLAIGPAWEF